MIYIVRHGQTDWNKVGRMQGRTDIPLNETGREQAREVGEKLKGIEFDKVFSSPLKRAYETAKIITNKPIEIDERLIERCCGELEGKTKNEIKIRPNFNSLTETMCGIEFLPDFKARIASFFDEILKEYPNKNILISTHAGVCLNARCYFEGEPENIEDYKLKNCEIITYKN